MKKYTGEDTKLENALNFPELRKFTQGPSHYAQFACMQVRRTAVRLRGDICSEGLTNTAGATEGNQTVQSGLAGRPALLLGCGLWSRWIERNYLMIRHDCDGATEIIQHFCSCSPVGASVDGVARLQRSGASTSSRDPFVYLRHAV